MRGAALMSDEARTVAAEAGHVVAAAGVARRAAVPARAVAEQLEPALVGEIREPVKVLRRCRPGPSFLHDWFLLPLAPQFQLRGSSSGLGLPVPTASIIHYA